MPTYSAGAGLLRKEGEGRGENWGQTLRLLVWQRRYRVSGTRGITVKRKRRELAHPPTQERKEIGLRQGLLGNE